MSRRKSGNTRRLNEREFPHVIELVVLLGSFGSRSAEFETFHRERSIPIRRGRSRHKANQSYVRFCFPDAATADAFQECFGGERLILAPSKPRALAPSPRSKHDRPYSPRVVGSKIMTPADLRRLHKYMLEMEITAITDQMRAVVENEWPELAHKLPPKEPLR
jgi:hypothetical protein